MCSLCITSITNINARLSAGKGTSVRTVCLCVYVCVQKMSRRMYMSMRVCTDVSLVYVIVSCKNSQKRILRGFARTNRWTRDLGTINTERLLSWACVCVFRNTWGWG